MTGRGRAVALGLGLAVVSLLGLPRALPAQQPTRPAEPRVFVSRFNVTGVTAFSVEAIHELVAEGEGRELTLAQIETLAARITARYRQEGYILARAYVPAQEPRDGVVEIAVLEGRIGRIEVNGARHYDPDFLRRYVEPDPAIPLFHAGRHERGLLLLNELPGLEVKSTLKPGSEPGTTDLVLDVEKDRPITGWIDANNYGSRDTGRERFGLGLSLNNPLGRGDALTFRGLASREGEKLWLVRAAYALPLNTLGTRAGVSYTHASVQTEAGSEFGQVDVRGPGDVGSLFLVHPFLRSRELSLFGQAGFDYKDLGATIRLEPETITLKDRLRVLSLGAALNTIDGWRGLSTLGLTVYQGIGEFLGGMDANRDPKASRPGTGGAFTKLSLEASRLQQLTESTAVFVRSTGQWGSTDLPSPEQFFVGGQGTVRGYPLAQLFGDDGYALTLEFRWNAPGFFDAPAFLGKKWGEILQVFGFVDTGGVRLKDPLPGERRARFAHGAGVGIQFGVADNFLFKVEWATPIRGAKPSDGLDNYIYFLAVKSF